MENIIYLIIFFNLLSFLSFLFGKHLLKIGYNPLLLSNYAFILGVFLLLNLIGNLYLCIYFFSVDKIFLSLISLLFFISPFIYGYLSNQKTSNLYINIQIWTFLINAAYVVGIIRNF